MTHEFENNYSSVLHILQLIVQSLMFSQLLHIFHTFYVTKVNPSPICGYKILDCKRGGLVTLRICQLTKRTACLRNNWFSDSGYQPGAAVYKVAVRQCHFFDLF